MIHKIEAKILDQNAHAVKYLKVQGLKDSAGIIKSINFQINRDFGLTGPLTLSTPSKRVHAIRWAIARESFVVETNVKRVTKETVAACIAQINKCPYCEDVHGTSISSAGDKNIAKAIENGTWQLLKDERTKEIVNWSLNTLNPQSEIIRNPPFTAKEAPEIIGTALVFHSTNRLVSIFLENSPFPLFLSNPLIKKTTLNLASKTLFKSMISKKADSGDALKFIEDYPFSKQFKWAEFVPAYSKALAAREILLKKIEHEVIPVKAVEVFKNKINRWQGEEMPLGKSWLTGTLNNLSETEKPVAQLMFLAAFAPYTIIRKDVENFRKIKHGDKELIEVCFWAIQILTDRIREWLIKPFE